MNFYNLPMEGRVIGESYYRVGEYLWKLAETETEKMKILNQQIRRGLEAKGGYEEPETLIKNMKQYLKRFKEYGLEEPKLFPNRKIMNVDLSNLI